MVNLGNRVNAESVQELVSKFKATDIDTLPQGEEPSSADIVIILGNNFTTDNLR